MISYEPLFQTMKKKGITSYWQFKPSFPQSNYYAIKWGENISTHTVMNCAGFSIAMLPIL